MDVLDAMRARSSVRAFLDKPVERSTVEAILDAARWAPSGVNTQPWRVALVTGETKRCIGEAIIAAREAGTAENPDYRYYPDEWFEPYRGRRKESGLALYQALGIAREDREEQKAAWYRNYRFFDAPVGLFCFLDRNLGQGSWVDMGMFLQNIMLAALEFGLGTCPQASLADYPDIVREALGMDRRFALVCGIALGHPDAAAPVNGYRTHREPAESFASWHD